MHQKKFIKVVVWCWNKYGKG